MSYQDSSADPIFDGLLRPDEEAYLAQLIEEMYGNAADLSTGACQSAGEQEDTEMTDPIEGNQSDETRQSDVSANTAIDTPVVFPADSTSYTHQRSMIDLTREGPVIDLKQETNSYAKASLTQQQPAAQPFPSFRKPTSAKQPATKPQPARPKMEGSRGLQCNSDLSTWNLGRSGTHRPDGEFGRHKDHTGNRKCAQILKAIYPDKFPASISIEVLANRVSPVWNDRDRGKKAEWDRVREMREEGEEYREDMRGEFEQLESFEDHEMGWMMSYRRV
ncbi:hypothetical protein AC579_2622 [Pseudocercospora musae]|uniref:Uncharacterized protein n=1 Tax=Pseudocercospora musae TaxID=113226 RepID=A0A139HUR4_9PEZI|nr:hypothetical protein AC579_2622 [Pseudocercospora musae]